LHAIQEHIQQNEDEEDVVRHVPATFMDMDPM